MEHFSYILVCAKEQLAEAIFLYGRIEEEGGNPLLLTDFGIIAPERFAQRNLQSFQDIFALDFNNIRQKTYDFFYLLSGLPLRDGITLRQLTAYRNVPLWDLSARHVFEKLIPFAYYIDMAGLIFGGQKPQAVYVLSNSHLLEKACVLFCKNSGIKIAMAKEKRSLVTGVIDKAIKEIMRQVKGVKRFLVSFFLFYRNRLKSFGCKTGRKIIFFAPTKRFFTAMLPVINKYRPEEYLVVNTYASQAEGLLKGCGIDYSDLCGYRLYSMFTPSMDRFLKEIRQEVEASGFFRCNAVYDKLPIGDFLSEVFDGLLFDVFRQGARMVDLVKRALDLNKPKAVVLADCSYDIALIARASSVPVISLQTAHPEEFIFFAPVVSDAVVVDGDYWKDYLIRHGAGQSDIRVTGSAKFDRFFCGEFSPPRPKSFKNIEAGKKIIILATTYSCLAQSTLESQKVEQIRSVARAIRKIPEVHLVLKLHPYDKDGKLYVRLLREQGLEDFTLVKDEDMFNLLYYGDLLITQFSTASYEAVVMGKNVLLLSGQSNLRAGDVWDFAPFNAVVAIDNLADMEKSIRGLLFDPGIRSLMEDNRKRYTYAHSYNLDGKASLRIKEVIDRYIYN
ncbi:MAG: hypothetical protein JW788_01830 [Candidatus Omnitrophica bacterium]|nr:hypothetical protein [Candidatus Omnitrophota bacterium]